MENFTLGLTPTDKIVENFQKIKNSKKLKKQVVFKIHFKPFQAILDHIFQLFFGWVPRENFKKVEKHDLKRLKMT